MHDNAIHIEKQMHDHQHQLQQQQQQPQHSSFNRHLCSNSQSQSQIRLFQLNTRMNKNKLWKEEELLHFFVLCNSNCNFFNFFNFVAFRAIIFILFVVSWFLKWYYLCTCNFQQQQQQQKQQKSVMKTSLFRQRLYTQTNTTYKIVCDKKWIKIIQDGKKGKQMK